MLWVTKVNCYPVISLTSVMKNASEVSSAVGRFSLRKSCIFHIVCREPSSHSVRPG